MRHDAAFLDFVDAQTRDEADDGVVGAAGFEGADFLEVLAFEVEVEGWGGGRGIEGGGGEAVEGCVGEEGGAVDVRGD